jgi:shikimate kinase
VTAATSYRFVVLLGLMGVGKTTVGRVVAARVGWRMSDSDEQIQARTGQTARDLERALGADVLHELEAEHLLAALSGEEPAVICAAAGTIEVDRCREALAAADALTVWLRAAPSELAERFGNEPHRPSYGDDPRRFLAAQLEARESLFRSVAGLTLETGGATAAELADAIIVRLAALT